MAWTRGSHTVAWWGLEIGGKVVWVTRACGGVRGGLGWRGQGLADKN